MRARLSELPAGVYRAADYLDGDGFGAERVRVAVGIRIARGRARVDFTGTAPQVRGGVNANFAVTLAAVYYVFRCLARASIPPNAGFMRPIDVVAPPATVVNAQFPAAVAGGNVETSQRIVDVLLCALAPALPDAIPAASCGSMNNLAFGGTLPSGASPAGAADGRRQFSYYETIAGGAGAGPARSGASALHTHMTNTMNTPVEALEAELPVRVTRYAIRPQSGGRGHHRGGDGIVREIEFLVPAQATLLTERRTLRPYGAAGGAAAQSGRNEMVRGSRASALPAKTSIAMQPGERLRILTPGGGGWGRPRRRNGR
jgi:N-methylhydantoinase B